MSFDLPPRLQNEDGRPRRVGFELEFGGVGLRDSAEILRDIFGGELDQKSEFVIELKTSLGTFQIEADALFLKEGRYARYFEALGLNPDPSASILAKGVSDAVAALAGTLVPFEIVTPPIEITKLDVVEEIRARLHQRSARGTHASVFLAFGMQFNPELPDLRADTIVAMLRAFLLLFDWIFDSAKIPLARQLSPYIHDFPAAYAAMVIDPAYRPDRDRFITEYLTHNPTRNRPLDLLPLLAHLDRDKVFAYPIERELVKARPTFHYRLPNSEIDDPAWTIARDWNTWVQVERLAADPDRARRMAEDHAKVHAAELFPRQTWIKRTREWLG